MTADALAPTPSFSATVSTVQGWPTIRHELETVIEAVRRVGGELVVTDGSGKAPPAPSELGENVRWSSHPGDSVWQLRAHGYRLATGDVVAVTEDHCAVPADWATKHIEAHRRHPDAIAIGGSVVNGATDTVFDWAGYLAVQCAVTAPIKSGPAGRLAGALNTSYKRAAIESMDDFDGLGVLDSTHQKKLASGSAPLIADDSIRVAHIQALGFRGTTAINFHAGRAVAGLRRRRFGPMDAFWLLGAPVVPIVRWLRVARLILPKGYGPIFARCGAAMLLLFYAQSAGHVVGYLTGPGDSPSHLL